jgi:hypothetical protein
MRRRPGGWLAVKRPKVSAHGPLRRCLSANEEGGDGRAKNGQARPVGPCATATPRAACPGCRTRVHRTTTSGGCCLRSPSLRSSRTLRSTATGKSRERRSRPVRRSFRRRSRTRLGRARRAFQFASAWPTARGSHRANATASTRVMPPSIGACAQRADSQKVRKSSTYGIRLEAALSLEIERTRSSGLDWPAISRPSHICELR